MHTHPKRESRGDVVWAQGLEEQTGILLVSGWGKRPVGRCDFAVKEQGQSGVLVTPSSFLRFALLKQLYLNIEDLVVCFGL